MNVLKPFLKQNRNRAFWSFITEQQNIGMNYMYPSDPESLCVHTCVHTHTDMHGLIHTRSLFSKRYPPPPPLPTKISFFSFLFLSSSSSSYSPLSLSLFFFWYFKAGSSGNGWNCHISVLAKEINANPITGSYHLLPELTAKRKKKKKKTHWDVKVRKKKKGLGREGDALLPFTFK